MNNILESVQEEALKSAAQYGDFVSTHEALGVLVEEMNELIESIRSNKLSSVQIEAIQVSAVAYRLAAQIEATRDEHDGFWKRSTGG